MSAVNPYAAPKAAVLDKPEIAAGEPLFFPVSLLKLALMSIATFGLYEVYWFYKNWKCVQRLDDARLNAPIRAIFYGLTSYWLFARMREHAVRADGRSIAAGPLALAVFVLSATWRLPDPWWLAGSLGFVPLLIVQRTANALNLAAAPDADRNSRFGGWNIAALVAGAIFLALVLIGLLVPD